MDGMPSGRARREGKRFLLRSVLSDDISSTSREGTERGKEILASVLSDDISSTSKLPYNFNNCLK